jgi:hypothetical protein
VHSRRALFERIPESIGKRAMDALLRHGDRLSLYLGEYAVESHAPQFPFSKMWITSKTKTEIRDVDFVINCVGIKPNSEPMKKHMAGSLDEKGFVKVDESLRVLRLVGDDGKEEQPFHHIFCIGDLVLFFQACLVLLSPSCCRLPEHTYHNIDDVLVFCCCCCRCC